MEYRCIASSIEGFIQQIAVAYVSNGYWFYVMGHVPSGKDPNKVDAKLIDRYDINISKWARARRKRNGKSNLQYIRFERTFVLLATHGHDSFFEQEGNQIRDCRRAPIKFAGYSISHRGGHVHVRIEQKQYKLLKDYLLDIATRRKRETLEREFFRLPFEPYGPVRRQLLAILRTVNRVRKQAGYQQLSRECLRFRRKIVKVFEMDDSEP